MAQNILYSGQGNLNKVILTISFDFYLRCHASSWGNGNINLSSIKYNKHYKISFWSTFWLFIEWKENGNLNREGQVPRQSERRKLGKTETDASHPHTQKKTHTDTNIPGETDFPGETPSLLAL